MAESSDRQARLRRDQEVLTEIASRFPYFDVKPGAGQPPTSYEMTFHFPGYINVEGSTSNRHEVIMKMPREYPRGSKADPRFDFKSTPVYHPNVSGTGWICLGFGHNQKWHFGYRIEDLVYQVAEIIIFSPSSFNLRSPARSMADWPSWIAAHQTPLYTGALFPDPTRKPFKKKPEKPQVRILEVKRPADPVPTPAPPAPQSAAPIVRKRRVLRTGK